MSSTSALIPSSTGSSSAQNNSLPGLIPGSPLLLPAFIIAFVLSFIFLSALGRRISQRRSRLSAAALAQHGGGGSAHDVSLGAKPLLWDVWVNPNGSGDVPAKWDGLMPLSATVLKGPEETMEQKMNRLVAMMPHSVVLVPGARVARPFQPLPSSRPVPKAPVVVEPRLQVTMLIAMPAVHQKQQQQPDEDEEPCPEVALGVVSVPWREPT